MTSEYNPGRQGVHEEEEESSNVPVGQGLQFLLVDVPEMYGVGDDCPRGRL